MAKRFALASFIVAVLGAAVAAFRDGLSLTETAHAAGFASSAHFSTAFRDMFGMMPSELLKTLESVGVVEEAGITAD